ncbi:MAG: nucleotide exchange factor GrpE [Bifidobacteriaceae bacterium]|jgi:molecular chaperone GrpE|nr:nucleotide exchange factor GrpE [Bifidobacteriaceae bacterium]
MTKKQNNEKSGFEDFLHDIGSDFDPDVKEFLGMKPNAEEALEDEAVENAEKANDLLEELRRERASFINYKRRTEQEIAHAHDAGIKEILRALLPQLDAIDRAKGDLSEAMQKIADGIFATFKVYNIEPYAESGDEFDATLHDAILDVPTENEKLTKPLVKEVVERGYKQGDSIIRHAKVITESPKVG